MRDIFQFIFSNLVKNHKITKKEDWVNAILPDYKILQILQFISEKELQIVLQCTLYTRNTMLP